jgi:hypothetical protein
VHERACSACISILVLRPTPLSLRQTHPIRGLSYAFGLWHLARLSRGGDHCTLYMALAAGRAGDWRAAWRTQHVTDMHRSRRQTAYQLRIDTRSLIRVSHRAVSNPMLMVGATTNDRCRCTISGRFRILISHDIIEQHHTTFARPTSKGSDRRFRICRLPSTWSGTYARSGMLSSPQPPKPIHPSVPIVCSSPYVGGAIGIRANSLFANVT